VRVVLLTINTHTCTISIVHSNSYPFIPPGRRKTFMSRCSRRIDEILSPLASYLFRALPYTLHVIFRKNLRSSDSKNLFAQTHMLPFTWPKYFVIFPCIFSSRMKTFDAQFHTESFFFIRGMTNLQPNVRTIVQSYYD